MSDMEHIRLRKYLEAELMRLDSQDEDEYSEWGKGYLTGQKMLVFRFMSKFLSRDELNSFCQGED